MGRKRRSEEQIVVDSEIAVLITCNTVMFSGERSAHFIPQATDHRTMCSAISSGHFEARSHPSDISFHELDFLGANVRAAFSKHFEV